MCNPFITDMTDITLENSERWQQRSAATVRRAVRCQIVSYLHRNEPGAQTRDRIVIGLINNMADAALESTVTQFTELLEAAAGAMPVQLRLSYLPEVVRAPAVVQLLASSYWPIDALMAEPPDALIVTGAEPLAPTLQQEPYWARLGQLLQWADATTVSSIWSCLAAHAAVAHLDGIPRQRLAQKCCGVFEHSALAGHALLRGVGTPLYTPQSRWNEVPVAGLRAAGYTLLSESATAGANIFCKQQRSLLLFFQGHPEYQNTTLLKEYRRDVGRFLNGRQAAYPTLPCGYFPADAAALLDKYRQRVTPRPSPELLADLPFAAVAAGLHDHWRADAVRLYGNWLEYLAAAKAAAPAAVSG
jgi:homoserine O-succinyltransferase